LKTLGIEKQVNESATQTATSSTTKNQRKGIKIDSIQDVIKSYNGSSQESSSDDDEHEDVDEVAQYIKDKISYPKGESLLQWWYNHSFIYKK